MIVPDKKIKHTPGPWGVDFDVSQDGPAIYGPDGICFALFQGNTFQDEANARLIAAAPELLEEVKTLIEVNLKGTETPEDLEGILEYAQRIVAKATGGES